MLCSLVPYDFQRIEISDAKLVRSIEKTPEGYVRLLPVPHVLTRADPPGTLYAVGDCEQSKYNNNS